MRKAFCTAFALALTLVQPTTLKACEGHTVVFLFDKDPKEKDAQLVMMCVRVGCPGGVNIYECY